MYFLLRGRFLGQGTDYSNSLLLLLLLLLDADGLCALSVEVFKVSMSRHFFQLPLPDVLGLLLWSHSLKGVSRRSAHPDSHLVLLAEVTELWRWCHKNGLVRRGVQMVEVRMVRPGRGLLV
jgi:hypothetical protein